MSYKNSMYTIYLIKNFINSNELAAVLDQGEIKYTVTRYQIYPY